MARIEDGAGAAMFASVLQILVEFFGTDFCGRAPGRVLAIRHS